MKTYTEIKTEIWNLMEKLDEIAPKWANAKAEYERDKELSKIKIAIGKQAVEGKVSNAEKEDIARAHVEYSKFVDGCYQRTANYYLLDANKKKIELKLDALRTLLSFEKEFIPKTR